MKKNDRYDSLPESNVMFICTFDPFKKGLYQYTFRERCDEDHNMLLGDGTEKHFYNCCYEGNDIPDDLKQLYEYIRAGKTGNDLTKKIDNAVIEGRKNETWRTQYMKERIIIYDAMRELREEIDEEKKRAEDAEKRADDATKRAEQAEEQVKKLEALLAAKS